MHACLPIILYHTPPPGGLSTTDNSIVGTRTGLVLLNRVTCTGSEATLMDCGHGDVMQQSCSGGQAGAICLLSESLRGKRVDRGGVGGRGWVVLGVESGWCWGEGWEWCGRREPIRIVGY